MDNNSIATLKDYEKAIERSFERLKRFIHDFHNSEPSQQNLTLNQMQNNIDSIKTNIGLMKLDICNLQDSSNTEIWQNKINEISKQNENYKTQVQQLKQSSANALNHNDIDIDLKGDTKKMTSEQAIKVGNAILKDDANRIKNMINITSKDLNTMKEVNRELDRQNEALENADKDLTEIDFSLKRAGEQMKTMFKMYATDKLIMCMIIVIILVIIAIIVVGAIGGKKEETPNTPKDIFTDS